MSIIIDLKQHEMESNLAKNVLADKIMLLRHERQQLRLAMEQSSVPAQRFLYELDAVLAALEYMPQNPIEPMRIVERLTALIIGYRGARGTANDPLHRCEIEYLACMRDAHSSVADGADETHVDDDGDLVSTPHMVPRPVDEVAADELLCAFDFAMNVVKMIVAERLTPVHEVDDAALPTLPAM